MLILNIQDSSSFSLTHQKRELRAHMALVMRSEEPIASYSMSSREILRVNRLTQKENQRLNAGWDLKIRALETRGPSKYQNSLRSDHPLVS